MNKLYDNLTVMKESFKEIKVAFEDSFGIDYTGKTISEYPKLITELLGDLFAAKSERTSLSGIFKQSDIVKAPPIDTSFVKDFSHMFNSTYRLSETRAYDMSSAENLQYMYSRSGIENIMFGAFGDNAIDFTRAFGYSPSLTTIEGVEAAKAKTLHMAFADCKSLTSVSLPDMSECVSVYRAFQNCTSLEAIEGFSPTTSMTSASMAFLNCTALKNMIVPDGSEICVSLDLSSSPLLTHESLISLINALSPNVSGKILYLHGDCMSKLSDEEIAMATDKGWGMITFLSWQTAALVYDTWATAAEQDLTWYDMALNVSN